MKTLIKALALIISFSAPAWAEIEVSLYTGAQSAPHSRVEGNDPGGLGDFSFRAKWEGKSDSMPPYYGVRATWWRDERLGFGLEFNHAKVYADDETRADNGFNILEFTDGLNLFTANVMYRWKSEQRRWTPYTGFGVGFAMPHVEVETSGGRTHEFQVTGPAVKAIAGISYEMNDRWAVFGEYNISYSQNEADLDNGGTLETDIVTNALNIGLAYRF
ncbi:outer membrane protein [Actibacterium sp. D379-3]